MNTDWRIGITLLWQICSVLNNHWKSVSMKFRMPIFIQSLDQKIQSSFMRICKTLISPKDKFYLTFLFFALYTLHA